MKILLINPPDTTGLYFYKKLSLHIGLLYLYATLKEDHDVRLVDMNFTRQTIEQVTVQEKPDVIGFSCYSSNRHAVFSMCRRVRSLDPHIKLVLGGYHATFLYRQILEHYDIDYIVVGEGEKTFAELIRALATNMGLDRLRGVAYRSRGAIVYRPETRHVPLESLPLLDYTPYIRSVKALPRQKSFIPVVSFSRGCPYRCLFCNRYICERYQRLPLQRACENLDNAIRAFPRSRIIISDNNFYLKDTYFQSICRHIIKSRYDNPLTVRGRVDNLEPNKVDTMVKAGADTIFLGVESGSQRVLDANSKNITVRQVEQSFALLRRHNLASVAYFILGLPGETVRTIRETEKLIMKIRPTSLVLRKCVLTPGSELYDQCVKSGAFNEANWLRIPEYFFYRGTVALPMLSYYRMKIMLAHRLSSIRGSVTR